MTRFFFSKPRDHALDGLLELGHAGLLLAAAHRQQCRLVHDVGQVRAHHARGHVGELLDVQRFVVFYFLEVHLEDGLAALAVGPVDEHLAVEAARPQQRRVQDLGPVGGGHQDDAHLGVEPVHLHQQLVEGLLALVMAAHAADAAGLAQGIQFVDEDDAGRLGLGLGEQVPHPGGAQADEHLDELRAAHAEERHPAFAGHGLGEQGLAGARRSDQQNAAGHPAADRGEPSRFLEEFDDLFEFLLGLVHAGDVVEAHPHLVLHVDLGFVLAQRHEPRLLALHALHHEKPDADKEKNRDDPGEQVAHEGRLHLPFELDVVAGQKLGYLRVDPHGPEQLALVAAVLRVLKAPLDHVGGDGHLGHPVFVQGFQELAVGNRFDGKSREKRVLDDQHHPYAQQNIPHGKFLVFLHLSSFGSGRVGVRAAGLSPRKVFTLGQ